MVKKFFLSFLMILFGSKTGRTEPQRLSLFFEPPAKEAYIGQEVQFQIKILDRIGLKDIDIIPAEWPNADIFLIKKTTYQEAVDKRVSYTANEFVFSLIPKSWGEMFFPSFCLGANAPTLISARGLPKDLKIFEDGKIGICSPSFSITVKELPKYPRRLFAATDVKLFDGVVPKSQTIPVGTPIKRSLLLAAQGTLPAFLPDFQMGQIKNGRFYNGKTERSMPQFKEGVAAALRQTIIFIPRQAGNFILPEVKVPWLNTRTGKIETSVVPSYTLTVLPDPEAAKEDLKTPVLQAAAETEKEKIKINKFLIGIIPFLFIVLGMFFYKILKKKQARDRLVKAVEEACLKGDFNAASSAILAWAAAICPDCSFFNLTDVKRLFAGKSDEFVRRLEELEMYLYGTGRFAKHLPMAKENLGKDICNAFKEAVQLKIQTKTEKKEHLPRLYPDDSISP